MSRPASHLVLNDGATFEGYAAGYMPDAGTTSGEFVFNTALSGYQEVITDPSYAGQIIAFTYPHIGNYGVTPLDDEASRPWCEGIVVRDLSDVPSNWRSEGSLEDFLVQHRVPVITGIDTRRLTRHLRSVGALAGAFGHGGLDAVSRAAVEAKGTDDTDFVTRVSTKKAYTRGDGELHVVALDYGIKATMVNELSKRFRLSVVPADSTAAQIR
ncbi:MAG TPA: carbamoyl-phosphate synthase domain-containing protein, partial [Acidimicrobiales bacterium]